MRRALLCLLIGFGSGSAVARAEPAPTRYFITSPSGRWTAVLDPASASTTVFRVMRDGSLVESWTMPGWHRVAALADDGEHLVVGYDGLGLVPANYDPEEPMVRFYRRGALVRSVTLFELVEPGELIRVQAWYHWGGFRGFDRDGRYVVETVDHELRFDPATGRVLARR